MSFRRIWETEVLCCHLFELSAKVARCVTVPQPACERIFERIGEETLTVFVFHILKVKKIREVSTNNLHLSISRRIEVEFEDVSLPQIVKGICKLRSQSGSSRKSPIGLSRSSEGSFVEKVVEATDCISVGTYVNRICGRPTSCRILQAHVEVGEWLSMKEFAFRLANCNCFVFLGF